MYAYMTTYICLSVYGRACTRKELMHTYINRNSHIFLHIIIIIILIFLNIIKNVDPRERVRRHRHTLIYGYFEQNSLTPL